jgi:hypothetical protein
VATLRKASLEWALKHVLREGDTDVFPKPFEFRIIKNDPATVLNSLGMECAPSAGQADC